MKYNYNYKDILNKKKVDLVSMNKEQLRRYLVALNKEANKRLAGLAKVNKDNYNLYMNVNVVKEHVNIDKRTFKPFSTRKNMTKKIILKEVTERAEFLSLKSSTVRGFNKIVKTRQNYLLDQLKKFVPEAAYNTKRAKPSVKKMATIMNRLEDMHYISQNGKATANAGELKSPEIAREAYDYMYEHPYMSIEETWSNIEKFLADKEKEYNDRQKENSYDNMDIDSLRKMGLL